MNSLPSTASDLDLMKRVAERDLAAFSQFYDRLAKPLFSLAVKILQQSEEAEEVVQEVMIKIWNQADSFDPQRGTPFGWAMTMTRSKAIDRLRSATRRARLRDEVGDEPRPEGAPDSATLLGGREQAATLQRSVSRLAPDQQEAIRLAFFQGLTQAEIAQRLQAPLGTVKARIRRGLLKLRESLEGKV